MPVSLQPLELLQIRALAERSRRELRRRTRPELVAIPSLVLKEGHPFNDLLRPARYKVYYGGRGAAKSWAFAEALVRRASAEPIRVLCTREYQTSIKDSVHRVLNDTITRLGMDSWFRVTDNTIRSNAGAEFIFKGLHHNVNGIKSTEGIDIAWVAEAENTTNDSLEVLDPTIRKPDSEIWIEFNVTDLEAPIYKNFVTNTPPETIKHKVNYIDNPFFPEVLRRRMEYMKSVDYAAYEHVWLGMAKKVDDSVIFGGKYCVEAFDSDLWKKAFRLHFGADFGFAKDPSTLIRSFILDNTLYIEYEAWGVGIEFTGEESEDGRGELEQLYDSVPLSRNWPIKGDNARPETISFLRGKGFNISAAEKWKGSVEDGIAHVKGFKAIVIHERCKHTAEEARLYSYKKDRISGEVLPIIIDKHNHCFDAIRYGLCGYIQRRGDLGVWARLAQT